MLGNSSQLDMVDTALFALCLDTEHPDDQIQLAKQYLYGDAANRSELLFIAVKF